MRTHSEVMQFRARICAFVQQFAPTFPPSWLAMVSISTEFLSVMVPGGGCRSMGCRGYLRALLDACISLGTTTRFHRHLSQAHLLVMSSMFHRV